MKTRHIFKKMHALMVASVPMAALLLASVTPAAAGAQVQADLVKTGLAISPPIFELSANPGTTQAHTIRVDNLSDKPMTVEVQAKNFAPLGEEGQAAVTDETTNYSLASWIKLDKPSLTLPARSSQVVGFQIVVPPQAEPGGHFGSVVFHTQLSPVSSGAAVGQEISSLVLLKVAGATTEKASIASFGPTKNMWEQGPFTFESRIKNEGNVHIKPTAKITITNMFGAKVSTVTVDSRTILPGTVRKFQSQLDAGLLPGVYTATLSVGYGDSDQLLTSTSTFTVFQYKVIIPIIILLVIAGLLVYRGRRRIGRAFKILFGKE